MKRKDFLKQVFVASAAQGLSACSTWDWGKASIQLRKQGPSKEVGHLIRDGKTFPKPTHEVRVPCVIVGAGVAGLSSAWTLEKAGMDFLLLEMESWIGGNAAWGENVQGKYPWGAHYLPIPNNSNTDLLKLLEDLGAIYAYDEAGLPFYQEELLCMHPQERLFLHGKWQEGLIPDWGVPEPDKQEIKNFLDQMEAFEQSQGKDGKYAFDIPLDQSSLDPTFLGLDKISMSDWMVNQGFRSPYLMWYVDYSCRDDFGTNIKNTSAWAGIHYFASRRGKAANAPLGSVLTWPEGNGWLVRNMAKSFEHKIRTSHMLIKLEEKDSELQLTVWDHQEKASILYRADQVILACPQFINQRLYPSLAQEKAINYTYTPWLVANIHLNKRPRGWGKALAWDNVAYGSPSLGYVVADHQKLTGHPSKKLTITWYHALAERNVDEERKTLDNFQEDDWKQFIINDLKLMHPGIEQDVYEIELWPWGHGMVSPVPNFLWTNGRRNAAKAKGKVHVAHSDLSGISIFEEAFYQGTRAAKEVLNEEPKRS